MKTMAHYTNNMQTKLDLPELEYPYSWEVTEAFHNHEADRGTSFLRIAVKRDCSSKIRVLFMSIFPKINPIEASVVTVLVGMFPEGTAEETIRKELESSAASLYKEIFPEPAPVMPPSPFAGSYIPDLF